MGLTRSQQMARIRGRDTRPERLLRAELWKKGLRYRLKYPMPVGRPDLVFVASKAAVFIDGCFWHGCPEHYVRPRSRCEFWSAKLEENVLRDHRQTLELEQAGWGVVRIWEHELFTSMPDSVKRVEAAMHGGVVNTDSDWRVIGVAPLDPGGEYEERELVDLRNLSIRRKVRQRRSTMKW